MRRPSSKTAVIAALFGIAALLVTGAALARSIYLNGVKIDAVMSQLSGNVFKNCEVKIDAHGNVIITAPGYNIKTIGSPTADPPPGPTPVAATGGKLTRRYWLVTQREGDAQYEVDVYINSAWVKKIRSRDEQIVYELTKHLKPGRNVVHFSGKKDLSGGRKAFGENVFVRVIIGEGNVGGDNVMIDNPLIDRRWTAAKTDPVSEDWDLNAR